MGLKPRPKREVAAAGAKGGRSRSAAKRAASKANGTKGGRPRKDAGDEDPPPPGQLDPVYGDIIKEQLGPPPEDILELCEWLARANAITLYETLQGRGSTRVNQEIRAAANTALRLIPAERLAELERRLKPTRSKRSKVGRARGVKPQPVRPSRGRIRG